MKRTLSLIMALVLCVAVLAPVTASATNFVPSIGYKDGPENIWAEMNEEDMLPCLVVTSILGAERKYTDIHQKYRDLLLDVYGKLMDGSMKLPLADSYVIRELVDINFRQTACIDPNHTHMDDLGQLETTITICFSLGISAGTQVAVLSYHDGEWTPIKSVVNNGDGTVTCEFDHFCPVVFCVQEPENGPTQTGDPLDVNLWGGVMIISQMGLAAMLVPVYRRKK